MKERLSTVYLDDYPVTLMGDEAAPPLSRIVRAGGKRPDYVDVLLLASPSDKEGRPVGLEEIIDRAAEPTRPIYLRTIQHDVKPIYTARPRHASSRPDGRKAVAPEPAMPNADPAIAQLGAKPIEDRPLHGGAVFRETEAQAKAEAEAEQRQEDERNLEDDLQDEAEAVREAGEDAESQV